MKQKAGEQHWWRRLELVISAPFSTSSVKVICQAIVDCMSPVSHFEHTLALFPLLVPGHYVQTWDHSQKLILHCCQRRTKPHSLRQCAQKIWRSLDMSFLRQGIPVPWKSLNSEVTENGVLCWDMWVDTQTQMQRDIHTWWYKTLHPS